MAEYITKIRTADGDKQIDYNALANLPSIKGSLNEVELASGTIPSGTVAWTNTETGLTINDLREWDRIMICVVFGTASCCHLTHDENVANTSIWLNNGGSNIQHFIVLEWLDDEKTILNGIHISGDSSITVNSEPYISENVATTLITPPKIAIPYRYRILDKNYFDNQLKILLNVAQTADTKWTIHGLLK